MSLKQTILGAKAEKPKEEWVEEWGTTVYLRVISGIERDSFESEVIGGGVVNLHNISAKLLVRSLCDENGVRVFDDADSDSLGQQSSRVLRRLYEKAKKLNAIFEDDIADLKKNSAQATSAASS